MEEKKSRRRVNVLGTVFEIGNKTEPAPVDRAEKWGERWLELITKEPSRYFCIYNEEFYREDGPDIMALDIVCVPERWINRSAELDTKFLREFIIRNWCWSEYAADEALTSMTEAQPIVGVIPLDPCVVDQLRSMIWERTTHEAYRVVFRQVQLELCRAFKIKGESQ